ncbi:MAG TPA: DUF1697 domain-containing protein [Bacteroidota bacterium]|nr:DUF1697 domain-containing protein [Bacteroidota bacterium]
MGNLYGLSHPMNTYISLLRGINVLGHKVIKMADLKALFESLKFKNVRTYIASGNVVFQSPEKDIAKLDAAIHAKIKKFYGFDVGLLTITPNELKAAIKKNPFPKAEPHRYCITFLSAVPKNIPHDEIDVRKTKGEEYTFIGKAMYLHCPNGFGKTKVTNAFLEKKLNVTMTSRNWNTVTKLLEMGKTMK